MKKTLMKITLVAAFLLSSSSFSNSLFATDPVQSAFVAFTQLSTEVEKDFSDFSVVSRQGLKSEGELKAYHLGLQALNSEYRIPNEKDLLDAIHAHPSFVGVLSDNRNVYDGEDSHFIFEMIKDGKEHFYLSHKKGIRHFVVNTVVEEGFTTPHLLNATIDTYYPSIDHFIRSTV